MLQMIREEMADDGRDGESADSADSVEEENQQELDAELARQAEQIRIEKTERLRKDLGKYHLKELEKGRIRGAEERARIDEESEGGEEEEERAGETHPGKAKKHTGIVGDRRQSSGNNKIAQAIKKRMHSEKQEGAKVVRKQPKRQKTETIQASAVVRGKGNASGASGMRLRPRRN